jgi:DNA-binding NtrC family response regulator
MPAATISIVDDDALLRLSLRDRFDREGYDLVEAGSCAEATARLTSDVDLVLLDFQLPDGDGLSVLRHIKQKSPETIVTLMTAYSSVSNAVAAMKLGASSSSRASCSDMNGAHSRTRGSRSAVSSRRQMAARCSSTRLGR